MSMTQGIYTVTENIRLTDTVLRMRLVGDTSSLTAPGQFINIKLEGKFLRRPISVCNVEGDTFTILYKAVGKGTEKMAESKAGEVLDVLTGLGNGYDTAKSGDAPLLVGGGAGVPPMYLLARRLIAEGKKVTVILGFNKAEEIFYREEFEKLGAKVLIATADGSVGVKGFVTDALGDAGNFT